MSLKTFASPAPAGDSDCSDCSVSKLVKVVNDGFMENVMSEKSWKSPEITFILQLRYLLCPKWKPSLVCYFRAGFALYIRMKRQPYLCKSNYKSVSFG